MGGLTSTPRKLATEISATATSQKTVSAEGSAGTISASAVSVVPASRPAVSVALSSARLEDVATYAQLMTRF